MFTNQMKQELIDKIISITDENILEEVYRIIEVGGKDIDRVVISNQQKESIDKGIKDIEEGNYLSNEDGNQDIEELLKK